MKRIIGVIVIMMLVFALGVGLEWSRDVGVKLRGAQYAAVRQWNFSLTNAEF